MGLLTDFNIDIKKEELILMLGGNLDNSKKALKIIEDKWELITTAKKLINPMVLYDLYEIKRIDGSKVYIEDEQLESKILSSFIQGADYAAISFLTLGPELENQTDVYMKEGKYIDAYMLDGIGTVCLQKIGNQAYDTIVNQASLMGLKCSSPISPGQAGWNVDEQRKIFNILTPEKLSITLTASNLLMPKKSVSFVLGTGKNLSSTKKACDFCPFNQTCPGKKVRDYQGR
ncbi:MAG: hypothetical protein K9L17_06530 [Clostridiales bacterium]|nr:hypothetical protein [Clostridiales bacterium]MCF8022328.1 hypothetical protein [Clostridiales bacterium]